MSASVAPRGGFSTTLPALNAAITLLVEAEVQAKVEAEATRYLVVRGRTVGEVAARIHDALESVEAAYRLAEVFTHAAEAAEAGGQ